MFPSFRSLRGFPHILRSMWAWILFGWRISDNLFQLSLDELSAPIDPTNCFRCSESAKTVPMNFLVMLKISFPYRQCYSLKLPSAKAYLFLLWFKLSDLSWNWLPWVCRSNRLHERDKKKLEWMLISHLPHSTTDDGWRCSYCGRLRCHRISYLYKGNYISLRGE